MASIVTPNQFVYDLFDLETLHSEIDAGYIDRRDHPSLPLSIYTYSRACQYEQHWTPATIRCRGLVVERTTGRIVALPFPKTFVTSMHGAHDFAPPLPDEPFEIFEKVDGSLIIVFWYDGRWHAASKGSFISSQALWAEGRLNAADTTGLDQELTYLAEAVYPGNRIVVNYGSTHALVLLAAFRTATGYEPPLNDVKLHWAPIGPAAASLGTSDDLHRLEWLAYESRRVDGRLAAGVDVEGYVIRFASGVRAKVKLSSYLKLHKLYTATNERTIWEVLSSGQNPAVLFDTTPDEFAGWVRQVAGRLRAGHAAYVTAAHAEFAAIGTTPDRKTFAEHAVPSPRRAALFRLYDGRSIDDLAWKAIKPCGGAPFKEDEEG